MPRHAYWTIVVGTAPTAFRARERETLVPTWRQLSNTQPTARLCWFERGRVWDSPEQATAARLAPRAADRRGKDWRPGGAHADPRARFRVPRAVKRARFRSRLRTSKPGGGRSGGQGA
jgi:hypothetical protein